MRLNLKSLLILAAVPFLAACENEGIAFLIGGSKDESLSLLREQRWFWSDEVEQAIVVSRMPTCLRRHEIRPGVAGSVKVEVYEAGDYMWALKQGKNWYLVGTENCELQRWKDAPDEPPGKLAGTFSRKSGQLEFIPAEQPATPIKPPDE
ncbi:MAG: hypothetical protein RBS05_22330 [Zoogloea oleivorans]|jgi:hypothetical protein|uniref:Lipoprotein n=1 Tax=Zoogloea oleivorans TaxID=1552750 RepID=A0A6C2CLU8_9RHOO|nr:hypothetical protein [Zoogloea oleivorans]MDY0038651.1 hypothetical protein [Zoogloea oleivorans]TYC54998.1 hypothetical protein ETQ85_16240 [Zoogloea oleivorans]